MTAGPILGYAKSQNEALPPQKKPKELTKGTWFLKLPILSAFVERIDYFVRDKLQMLFLKDIFLKDKVTNHLKRLHTYHESEILSEFFKLFLMHLRSFLLTFLFKIKQSKIRFSRF